MHEVRSSPSSRTPERLSCPRRSCRPARPGYDLAALAHPRSVQFGVALGHWEPGDRDPMTLEQDRHVCERSCRGHLGEMSRAAPVVPRLHRWRIRKSYDKKCAECSVRCAEPNHTIHSLNSPESISRQDVGAHVQLAVEHHRRAADGHAQGLLQQVGRHSPASSRSPHRISPGCSVPVPLLASTSRFLPATIHDLKVARPLVGPAKAVVPLRSDPHAVLTGSAVPVGFRDAGQGDAHGGARTVITAASLEHDYGGALSSADTDMLKCDCYLGFRVARSATPPQAEMPCTV